MTRRPALRVDLDKLPPMGTPEPVPAKCRCGCGQKATTLPLGMGYVDRMHMLEHLCEDGRD